MDNRLHNATLGIWGYGISGKSLVRFLKTQDVALVVFDQRHLSEEDATLFDLHGIKFCSGEPQLFLDMCDYVIPSPGVDVRKFDAYKDKFIAELDLFQSFFTKPIIGITGTLGKTTVTGLVEKALDGVGISVCAGGNIGIGLFDLIAQQDRVEYAVLELSSFQLELCKTFAPAVAVWTNFYPNHLDRHGDVKNYRTAKDKICMSDRTHLIRPPLSLSGSYVIPQDGFEENWSLVISVLEHLGIKHDAISDIMLQLSSAQKLEHRLELVDVIDGITFINDSKATVPEATLAAVKLYDPSRTILLLGGLDKDIDRRPLLSQLSDVKIVICFGAQAEKLYKLCIEFGVAVMVCNTLEESFVVACDVAQQGDTVLLSPSGSSFDLYKNYEERGIHFKKLVKEKNS
ncbi:MAG TPA: UDP-N-acetylmuramoyl-L-alanine--D-glutamate ligase [Candidatus Babeliales bacterium]|nr:UDP-N-acetylmuramoyl-L-alanine--D-glutamate ligase [Candidatus Babeliales bacterium]